MQPYLVPNSKLMKLSELMKLVKFTFSLRTRMVQVRENFRSSYTNTDCELCKEHSDSQQNLLLCKNLVGSNSVVTSTPCYEDLFSDNVESQLKIALLLQENFKQRKSQIGNMKTN